MPDSTVLDAFYSVLYTEDIAISNSEVDIEPSKCRVLRKILNFPRSELKRIKQFLTMHKNKMNWKNANQIIIKK